MLRKVLLVAVAALVVADMASATNYCRCGPEEPKMGKKGRKDSSSHDSSDDHHSSDDRKLTNCYTRICESDKTNWRSDLPVCTKSNVCSNGPYTCDNCPAPACEKAGGVCVKNCKRCTANCKSVSYQTNVPFLNPAQCATTKGDCPADKVCCKSSPPDCSDVGGKCVTRCGALDYARYLVIDKPITNSVSDEKNRIIARNKIVNELASIIDVDTGIYVPSIGSCKSGKVCCIAEKVVGIDGPVDPTDPKPLNPGALCTDIMATESQGQGVCLPDCGNNNIDACCAGLKAATPDGRFRCQNANSDVAAKMKMVNQACKNQNPFNMPPTSNNVCCVCVKMT